MCSVNDTTFWMEAGAMQGGSRNQLEMTNDLAEFFGPEARASEVLTIQLQPGLHFIRPFVYRGDDYGHYTDRWRLCLPTAQTGGPDYADRVIRFDRVQIGGATVFQLTVADINSAAHHSWRNKSSPPNGTLGTTQGGRQYGSWHLTPRFGSKSTSPRKQRLGH
jgi:hypothetical protein